MAHIIRTVSTAANGTQGNYWSDDPAISADARYVAFASLADNLVAGDTNGAYDVFVKDLWTGATTRASITASGAQGGSWSGDPAISSNGRFVAFASDASNLVTGDRNGAYDVFVKDVQTGATTRVSTAASGAQGNAWSGDPALSANGRFVAFASDASNLVAGDTNGSSDVFVKDRQTGATTRMSTAADGRQGDAWSGDPAISADGRLVVFASDASNLVAGDTNGTSDVFVKDQQTGAITRMSTAASGGQGDAWSGEPVISADGRYVAFSSYASNLVAWDANGSSDVFVKDRQTGAITPVSTATDGRQGDAWSGGPAISGDGRYVAYVSSADNLVAGDTNGLSDVFVKDMWTGVTTRLSTTAGGTQGGADALNVAISADGSFVGLASDASNLVAGDTNGFSDVFATQWLFEGRSITINGLEYIASYGDLIQAFGANADAGATHYIQTGRFEGRTVSFDGLEYIASYGDLIQAFGANADAGAIHYMQPGRFEGRAVKFDGLEYIASYGDLINAFCTQVATNPNPDIGANHYILAGYAEHRATDLFNAAQYLANYADLQAAFGANTEAATAHYITNGYFEHRTDHPLA